MRFLLNAIAVLRGTRPPENLPADQVASQLASAREAIRLGLIDQAHAALASSKWGAVRNAARLNLLGVVHELRRDWKGAKKYYGRAVRAAPGCEAAQRNLRRFYELDTFGRCADTIALGDEGPALMRL